MEKLNELIDAIEDATHELCACYEWGSGNSKMLEKRLQEAKEELRDYAIALFEGRAHLNF